MRSASTAGAWCRVKAVISSLDGVLAAEEEAKISAGLDQPGMVGQSRKQFLIEATCLVSQILFFLALVCAFASASSKEKHTQHHQSM